MTILKLSYIHRFKDRHGKVRFYFRRPGYPRVALPGLPGSADFMNAYQAAIEANARPIGATKTKPGSISALITLYYLSSEYQQLATVTRATYRNVCERFRAEHGDKPVALLQWEHVRRIVAARASRPSAANSLLKMLRILMQFAVTVGIRRDDPTIGVKRVKTAGDGHATWSESEIAQFEAYWPSGSRQRLAMALLLFTAQRKSDVIRMGRQHVRGGLLDVRQQKTGTRLTIPVHPALQAEIDALPADQLIFLVTREGAPFTAAGFGNWFHDVVEQAGIGVGRTAHGLRKAAARRLAEAGCSTHEIMAVGGWRTVKECERYTRAAGQAQLAESAMRSITSLKTTAT